MKLVHKPTICLILVLSIFVSIPMLASANQNLGSKNMKDDTTFFDSSANNLEQNEIPLLTVGQHYTTKPIQVIDTNYKADVNYNILSGFGNISYLKSIVIDSTENSLLCTFEHPDESLQLIKHNCKAILNILSDKYILNELSDSNWKEYQKAINEYSSDLDSNEMYEEQGGLLKQFQSLEAALYIYEDTSLNNEVLDFVSRANTELSDYTISKIVLDNIIGHLPYTDSLVRKNQKSISSTQSKETGEISLKQISGLTNLIAANSYALAHATSYNRDDYPDFSSGGDCTNFVSQICVAGGVPMNLDWHCVQHDFHLFTWSYTWSVASEFANYWKPRWYTGLTTDHYLDFSKQLYTKGGSVIGMDTAGNKVYYHLAYVTQRANNLKTKFGRTFYDYYITQHSSDYQSWASDNKGTANGWVNAPDGTIFAIFS